MSHIDNYITHQKSHFIRWHSTRNFDLYIVSVNGSEGLFKPFHYELDAIIMNSKDLLNDINNVGFSCEIGDASSIYPSRIIHGVVTSLVLEKSDSEYKRCKLKLEPAIVYLMNSKRTKVWSDISIPDIIKNIVTDFGIYDIEFRLYKSYPPQEYRVQYKESDYDFMHRIMCGVGIYYFFKHEVDKHTIIFTDNISAHPSAKHEQLKYESERYTKNPDRVSNWHTKSNEYSSHFSLYGYNIEQASSINVTSESVYKTRSGYDISYSDITSVGERRDLNNKIEIIVNAHESNTKYWSGNTEAWWLASGDCFQLSDSATSIGKYYLQAMELSATNSHDLSSGSCICKMYALEEHIQWYPQDDQKTPLIPGILIAKVVGPASEEIHTDKYGRVKIQFPWEPESDSKDTSCWVRVSQIWSGTGFGCQFVPRIGSEVFVSFIQGDPDSPVIIGSVYNGRNCPPFELPNKKSVSGFITRSSDGQGHQLSFEDQKGEESITLSSCRDFCLTVNNDARQEIGNKLFINISGGRDTVIDKGSDIIQIKNGDLKQSVCGNVNTEIKSGDYNLKVNGGGIIKSDRILELESTQAIKIKVGSSTLEITPSGITISSTTISLDSKAITELKGTMISAEGSAITQIKGGIVNIG